MKICGFMSDLSKGGAQGVFVTVMNYFATHGYQVEIVVQNLYDPIHQKQLCDEISVVSLDCISAKKALGKLVKYVLENDFDIAWAFTPELAINVLFAKIITRKQYSLFARSINTLSVELKRTDSKYRKFVTGTLLRLFYKRMDAIVAQSQGMKEDLIRNFGVPREKVFTINNALSDVFEKEIYGETFKERKKVILYVGRLEPQKGINLLIEAFQGMQNKATELLIIGDGSLKSNLRQIVCRSKLEDRVKFVDYTENIIDYYKTALCVAMTSYFEGFPNVLIEANACGTPVVSFDLPSGPKEIILEDCNGILVEYMNVSSFSKALDKAVSIEWDYERIKESAKRYTKDKVLGKYLEILRGNK